MHGAEAVLAAFPSIPAYLPGAPAPLHLHAVRMEGGDISLFGSRKPAGKKRKSVVPADAQEQRAAAEVKPAAGREQQGAQPPAEDEQEATFRSLGLSEWLDRVCASMGMRAPTAVQRGTIPAVLGGRDVIGVAHTGSGKTAAFALPILQKLAKDPFGVFALVLTPTR